MRRICFAHSYDDIISVENLLAAWREFLRGKRNKEDVQEFQYNLSDNIYKLHHDLKTKTYRHGKYYAFKINDPKPRDIHKATVRDRLLHHAIYRKLYPFFDKTFIYDSYSCRLNKGTHKALNRFSIFARKVSNNNTRTCWVLKCDIRKFFANIDHDMLFHILEKHITDPDILWLLKEVVGSFPNGLPLGNLTSQLLVNIYMNEFDQCVKHELKITYYIRYADDFVFLSTSKNELQDTLKQVEFFLRDELKLELHPNKVSIETFASGVDFLGWVHFPNHRVLRTSTKRRMLKRVCGLKGDSATVISYKGLLKWGNTNKLQNRLP
jgi:RNA-directed DNA polymerase